MGGFPAPPLARSAPYLGRFPHEVRMSPLNYIRLSLMMFIQFFLWGAWYVANPGYLTQVGFDGGDFAWTYSVGPIAGMISPFFVGMIADRFFATERVLGIMHLLGAAAMFAAAGVTKIPLPEAMEAYRPDLVNLLFFGHMLCFFPTLSLTNTLAMHTMTNPEKQFP
jgi:MFS family permease